MGFCLSLNACSQAKTTPAGVIYREGRQTLLVSKKLGANMKSTTKDWSVTVTNTCEGESVSATAQASTADGAFRRAQALAQNGLDEKTRPINNDFPEIAEPVTKSAEVVPLNSGGNQSKVATMLRPSTKPAKTAGLDAGVIQVLKDACESEGVPYTRPESQEQAYAWITAIREDGARFLDPNLTCQKEATSE